MLTGVIVLLRKKCCLPFQFCKDKALVTAVTHQPCALKGSQDGEKQETFYFLDILSLRNSLMVQWLGLPTSTAGGTGLIPGRRNKDYGSC